MRSDSKSWLWLAPSLAAMSLLFMFPMAETLWLAFRHRVPVFGIDEWVGLGNYLHLARNPRFWHSAGVTLYFTALSVSLELALGLGMALLLWDEFKGQSLALGALLVPWILPTSVAAKMWEWVFNPKFGILNHLLLSAHLIRKPVVWLGSPSWAIHAAILADLWKTAPFMALLLWAGLKTIPAELYRAAEVDGAGPLHRFVHITLPGLKPMILVALLFRTLDAVRAFDVIYVLTGGGPANTTETISIYAYKVLFGKLDLGYGSAIGVAVVLCCAALSGIFLFSMREAKS